MSALHLSCPYEFDKPTSISWLWIRKPQRQYTLNKFCVNAVCSLAVFRLESHTACRRRLADKTAFKVSSVSNATSVSYQWGSDLFERHPVNEKTSSCKTTSSVPNISDTKIVVSFRVETFVGAYKASHWNNSCFCPCAQDLKSVRKKIYSQKLINECFLVFQNFSVGYCAHLTTTNVYGKHSWHTMLWIGKRGSWKSVKKTLETRDWFKV